MGGGARPFRLVVLLQVKDGIHACMQLKGRPLDVVTRNLTGMTSEPLLKVELLAPIS